MKKDYIQPLTETVQMNLKGSVLDEVPVVEGSFYTGSGLGKKTNNLDWDEEGESIYPGRRNLWDD